MRTYASISPMFWTRGSGKRLRGDHAAQLVALYLMTSPATSMVGIFHLALPTLCHETGLPLQEALKGLQRCSEEQIAFWDDTEELVFIPALAKHQIGENLKAKDHKVKGVMRALAPFKGHKFYALFMDRYAESYCLPEDEPEAPSESHTRDDAPVLSCPVPEKGLPESDTAPTAKPVEAKPEKPKRAPNKTRKPDDLTVTEDCLRHTQTKGYPEWWVRNRFEAFEVMAVAKGWVYADWMRAFYDFLRREIEWNRGPDQLSHVAPRGGQKPATVLDDASAEGWS